MSKSPADELQQMISDEISGKRVSVPFPWPILTHVTQALLPGTLTVLCGTPGASKSLFMLVCLAYWMESKVPSVLFALEEVRAFHMKRLLAQRAGRANLTDAEWVRGNPNIATNAFMEHSLWSHMIGRMLEVDPDGDMDYLKMLVWIKERAWAGERIIVVDPISHIAPDREIAAADRAFVKRCKHIAEDNNTTIILVTHPRGKEMGLDDLAGGRAWGRFPQTVLWLENLPKPKKFTVAGDQQGGDSVVLSNRVLHVMKARNACGNGFKLAYWFQHENLCFQEQGVIVK